MPMTCDACSKVIDRLPEETEATKETWTSPGLRVVINGGGEAADAYMKRQMGPYQLNREYNVCWECWLKAMGVKP